MINFNLWAALCLSENFRVWSNKTQIVFTRWALISRCHTGNKTTWEGYLLFQTPEVWANNSPDQEIHSRNKNHTSHDRSIHVRQENHLLALAWILGFEYWAWSGKHKAELDLCTRYLHHCLLVLHSHGYEHDQVNHGGHVRWCSD